MGNEVEFLQKIAMKAHDVKEELEAKILTSCVRCVTANIKY